MNQDDLSRAVADLGRLLPAASGLAAMLSADGVLGTCCPLPQHADEENQLLAKAGFPMKDASAQARTLAQPGTKAALDARAFAEGLAQADVAGMAMEVAKLCVGAVDQKAPPAEDVLPAEILNGLALALQSGFLERLGLPGKAFGQPADVSSLVTQVNSLLAQLGVVSSSSPTA